MPRKINPPISALAHINDISLLGGNGDMSPQISISSNRPKVIVPFPTMARDD